MIPFEEIDKRLDALTLDRKWLSEASGRKPDSIRVALAPNAPTSKRSELLQKALSDPIEKEEDRRRAHAAMPDRLTIEAPTDEAKEWNRAAAKEGIPVHDWAVIQLNKAAEEWARQKAANADADPPSNLLPFELPFLGSVAAGEPVSATLDETVAVPRAYPPGHFVIQINGHSGEPQFMDGDRWVIDGRDCFTPKKGKPCVVSDGYGSYLKKWNPKRQAFESINPAFNDVIPLADAKLQGYPVERLA